MSAPATDWPSEEAVERAAFEAWAAGAYSLETHAHNGGYASHPTRVAWDAWQARALAAAPSPQVAVDETADEAEARYRRYGDLIAAEESASPPVAATGAQEAVAWEVRTRVIGRAWEPWRQCTREIYDNGAPGHAGHSIEVGYRALYATPPPSSGSTALPKPSRYDKHGMPFWEFDEEQLRAFVGSICKETPDGLR